ncbi:hypothetical protein FHT44_005169 [Mycolicibacterium sp. BK634]|uniref:ATP-grasp domain-containing protein n=1 Tax=Mycolicibacterium sp. BK634 TaxID=2587099 RepID=UPI00161FC862|nr:ATP-grasp domain-containing protein [Mycolicibacterium sp. BK634]MBB3752657.1 hypothetical protein [Mycolicibacterium sp. BK634]
MTRPFRVVTQKNWIAEQFVPMGAVHDWGFDIDPVTAPETIWWAPGAWVASALKSGVHLPLMSCGPHWLGNLPIALVGRRIVTGRLDRVGIHDNLRNFGEDVFVKLPEAKLDSFPAALHRTKDLRETLAQSGLPGDTLIQIQDPMFFSVEARYWVARGEIVAASLYQIYGTVWGAPNWEAAQFECLWSAEELDIFARMVVREVPGPPGYVLDVGMTEDVPFVIEANAAWSSGTYDGDPAGIFAAIEASHDFTGEHPEWAWNPNPSLYTGGPLKVLTS